MKQILSLFFVLAVAAAADARTVTVTVNRNRYQTVTGFGAACCDGAMCPFGEDTAPVNLLYGPRSKVGLNIMRMEISPNFYDGGVNNSKITSKFWNTFLGENTYKTKSL